MNNKMYCCLGFENLIGKAGQRGAAAIVVWRGVKKLSFLLQSRGVAYEDEALMVPMPVPITVTKSSTIGLQYCPFCGRRLKELLNAAPAEYA
jgi:hypothetical protein